MEMVQQRKRSQHIPNGQKIWVISKGQQFDPCQGINLDKNIYYTCI
jgi:hypothetical protein